MKQFIQVAADIYQVCLPLPFILRSVNCYLLRDEDGWTVVDTGLNRPETRAIWQDTFTALKITPHDINQIVLTHFHPDHYGAAGWLQQWSGGATPVYMALREAELARFVWGLTEGFPEPMIALFTAHGLPAEAARKMGVEVWRLRRITLPHPTVTVLSPGGIFRMGQRDFQVIHAPGHSDAQLIFYDPADRLILSGDQVLMKITPTIGTWTDSDPEPLGRYLTSLRELHALDIRVGLPGHGPLITDWQGRLLELEHHHTMRLDQMYHAVGQRVTAYGVANQVFNFSKLTPQEMRFAVAETVAHLNFLVGQGHLRREFDGGWIYIA